MDFSKTHINHLYEFSDVQIILKDLNKTTILNLHKIILAYHSKYFYGMFSFNPTKNSFEMIVDNVNITESIIMTFYGVKKELPNYPEWKIILETHKCRNYLSLDNDVTKLYNLKVPSEGFCLLFEVLSEYDLSSNKKLIRLIKNNLPIPLEELPNSNLFGPDNDDLVRELLKNDNLVVSGSSDHSIKIWNIDLDECIKTLEGHTDRVKSVAISTDNQYIVSGSFDNSIKIWDVDLGECIKTLKGHTDWVNSVAISTDNQYIVSGSYDCSIRIWDIESGQCIKTLKGHTDWINSVISVAISTDNQYIVSGSMDNSIKIWDVSKGECIKTLKGHDRWVNSVAISTDNQYIVSGSGDHSIKIWDMAKGECIKTLNEHTDWVISVAIYCFWQW